MSYKSESHKSVLQECFARVSYKSEYPQECPTRVSYKSVSQECPTRTSPTRVSYKSVLQECSARVSHKSECHTKCPTRVRKSVPQGFPKSMRPTSWHSKALPCDHLPCKCHTQIILLLPSCLWLFLRVVFVFVCLRLCVCGCFLLWLCELCAGGCVFVVVRLWLCLCGCVCSCVFVVVCLWFCVCGCAFALCLRLCVAI